MSDDDAATSKFVSSNNSASGQIGCVQQKFLPTTIPVQRSLKKFLSNAARFLLNNVENKT